MAGTPSIMEGRLVAVLSQVIPTLHQDMHVEFLPAIFFEVAKGNVIHISDVAEAYGQTFNGKVRTMNDFSNEFESLATEWAKMNTKFIFVANVGLPETSDEHVADTDVTRIHRSDREWMWAFAHAALNARQLTKDEDVAEIFVGPQLPALYGQISSLWGERTCSSAAKHPTIPVIVAQAFSTPSGFTVLAVIVNEVLANDPVEAWDAPDFVAWMDRHPGSPISPSMVAKLMIMTLFKERPMRKQEEDMLKAVSVRAGAGCLTSMSRGRFLASRREDRREAKCRYTGYDR